MSLPWTIWTWGLSEEEEPAKKKKGAKRKKTPKRTGREPRRERLVFGTGVALANERVYVFARLHQMIYSRLLGEALRRREE